MLKIKKQKIYILFFTLLSLIISSCASFDNKKNLVPQNTLTSFNYKKEISKKEIELYNNYINYAIFLIEQDKQKYSFKIESLLEKAVFLNTGDTTALLTLIDIYQQQKVELAEKKIFKLCKEIVSFDEINIKTAIIIAFICYDYGYKKDAAQLFYKIGISKGKASDLPYFFASYLLNEKTKLKKEEYEKLIFATSNFLKAAPQNDTATFVLATSYYATKEYKKAINHFKEINSSSNLYLPASIEISKIYLTQKEYNKAIENLKLTIQNFPEDEEAYFLILKVYKELEDYQNIIVFAKEAINKKVNSTEFFWILASAYYDIEKPEKALETLNNALLSYPENRDIKNLVAYFYAEKGIHLNKAEEIIKTVLNKKNKKRDEAYYLDTLAWIHFKKNEIKEAKEILLKANKILPNTYKILEHLGDIYYESEKNKDISFLMYQKALKYVPEDNEDKEKIQEKIDKNFSKKAKKE